MPDDASNRCPTCGRRLDPGQVRCPACTSLAVTVAPAPEAPARAIAGGRYRVGRFLGRGAAKQVFLAEDTELDREVAISFVGRVASDAAHVRYQREVRAMARLGDHPNVVSVYDVGTEEDGTTSSRSTCAAGRSPT